MSTTILLIRHGETEWNRDKRFRGTHDVPLNDNGRRQADLLGEALRGRQIDAAYTSPLSRAVETAERALAGHQVEPMVDERLLDFCYGDWTGLPDAEVARRWPREHEAWTHRPHTVRPPAGNTLEEVYKAAFGAMEQLAEKRDDRTVALFAHRVVNELLVLGVLGLAVDRFGFIRQDNCCLNEFRRVEGGYVVIALNDTSHLRQAGAGVLTDDF